MGKRELPTRHNFLTEAIQELLESKVTDNEPLIDQRAVLTITSNLELLQKYPYDDTPIPPSNLSNESSPTSSTPSTPNRSQQQQEQQSSQKRKTAVEIKQVPDVRIIEPITKRSLKQQKSKAKKALLKEKKAALLTKNKLQSTAPLEATTAPTKEEEADEDCDDEEAIPDDYYLKRHRRHEMEEKKQKNREKEMLRHGYYQQKQLVERIKSMDRIVLQSIVSSIRHRTSSHKEEQQKEDADDSSKDKKKMEYGKESARGGGGGGGGKKQEQQPPQGADEEDYLDKLHQRLLYDALQHLRRYEVLGFSSGGSQNAASQQPTSQYQSSTAYHIANNFEKDEKEEEEEAQRDKEETEEEAEQEKNSTEGEQEKTKTNRKKKKKDVEATDTIAALEAEDETVEDNSMDKKNGPESSVDFRKAMEREERIQRSRRISTFGGNPILTGGRGITGSRRSTRHVLAFGHKVPDFDIEEFELPYYVIQDWEATTPKQKQKKAKED